MKKIILLGVIVMFFSCTKDERKTTFTPITITPNLIGKGDNIYRKDLSYNNMVISNQNDWTALIHKFDTINKVTKNFTTTNVDFNNYELLAAIDTLKPHGGYSIEITNVVENANTINVTIQHLLHGDETQQITQPYHIVQIPKSAKPVVFQ